VRILFVNPGGRAQGGAERSLAELISGLTSRGHECFVFVMAPGDATGLFEGVGAHVVGVVEDDLAVADRHRGIAAFASGALRALPTIAGVARQIRAAARTHNVDLIHSNGFRSHILTPLYAGSTPVIWSLRDHAPRALHRRLLALASTRADAVLANSAFTAGQLHRHPRVRVVANPVAARELPGRSEARRSLGIEDRAVVLALLAHLHPSKGHDTAVDAVAQCGPDVHLVVAGGHLYSDSSDYEESLRARIAARRLDGRVHMLGTVDDVSNVYAAADIVCHPCRYPEGFGRVIVEAQLAGRPVVATGLGGVLDLVSDGRSGLLIPPDDPAALARAVGRIVDDRVLRSRLMASGRDSAQRFTPERHVEAVVTAYRETLGDDPVSGASPPHRRAG